MARLEIRIEARDVIEGDLIPKDGGRVQLVKTIYLFARNRIRFVDPNGVIIATVPLDSEINVDRWINEDDAREMFGD